MTQQEFDTLLTAEFKKYVGQKEIPENAGFEDIDFETFMIYYGFRKGYSWCALFVRAVVLSLLERHFPGHANNKKVRLCLTAGVLLTYAKCKGSNLFICNSESQDCSIGFFGHGRGLGHEVYIQNRINPNLMNTIEGNTNEAGSREGDCVAEKTRKITHIPAMNFLGSAKIDISKW
jgi:hypothetical protein